MSHELVSECGVSSNRFYGSAARLQRNPFTIVFGAPKAFASRKPIHLSTMLNRAGVSDPGYSYSRDHHFFHRGGVGRGCGVGRGLGSGVDLGVDVGVGLIVGVAVAVAVEVAVAVAV